MSKPFLQKAYKLYVGNLAWSVSSKELKEYFSHFGHVSNANVVFDLSTGISKSYGFVILNKREAYDKVTSQTIHHLEGKFLSVENAKT